MTIACNRTQIIPPDYPGLGVEMRFDVIVAEINREVSQDDE